MPQSPRVLIIDDDPACADFLAVAVRAMGFRADVLRDGQVGADAARAPGPPPSLVLLDALLPKVDGFQVLAAWQQAHPEVPVVIVSGIYKKRQYQQEAVRLGAKEHVSKPLSVLQVWELVSRYLGDAASEVSLDELQGLRFTRRPLPQVVAELNHSCATGLLFVRGAEGSAVLFLEEGRVVFARNSDEACRLDRVVAESFGLDARAVARLGDLVMANRGRVRLGEMLVADGLLTSEQLETALREQQRRNVARPFTWPQSASYFFPTDAPRHETFKLHVDTAALALWGCRHLSADDGIQRHVPRDAKPRMAHAIESESRRFGLSDDEVAFLRLVDGTRELRKLRAIGRLAQVDADRLLIGLHWLGMIEPGASGEPERAASSSNVAVAGDLTRTPPGRLLVSLYLARRSGALRFESPQDSTAARVLYLEDGLVAFASSSDPDDRLGQVLLRSGYLQPEELERALEVARAEPQRYLGRILVDMGLLGYDELHGGLVAQVTQVIGTLVGLPAGAFTFEESQLPRRDIVPLSLDTLDVVVRAARGQPAALVEARRPAPFARLRATRQAMDLAGELSLTPLEDKLLRTLDGTTPVTDLPGKLEIDPDLVARSLDTLLLLGLAEPMLEPSGLRPDAAQASPWHAASAASATSGVSLDANEILGDLEGDGGFAGLDEPAAEAAPGTQRSAMPDELAMLAAEAGLDSPRASSQAESFAADDFGEELSGSEEFAEDDALDAFGRNAGTTASPLPGALEAQADAAAIPPAPARKPQSPASAALFEDARADHPLSFAPTPPPEASLAPADLPALTELLHRLALELALDPASVPSGALNALPEDLRRRFGL